MEFVRTDQPLHPLYSNLNNTRSDHLFQSTKFVDLTALTPPSSNPFRASGTFNSPSSPMLSFGDSNSPVDSNVTHGIVTREDSIIRAHKRHNYLGEEQASKKHCIGIEKVKAKRAESIYSQSIAAKNRRQRISQRLRTLQELVPNGTKVDLVTMLETAISYVKFLQLQVKVLERDELWPSQEGNAETCEMKEAIDAIYRLQARKAWKSALQD